MHLFVVSLPKELYFITRIGSSHFYENFLTFFIRNLSVLLLQPFNYYIVAFRPMRKGAAGAVLNGSFLALNPPRTAGTFFPQIKGAETEQAVHFLNSLMAGVIFTFFISKETVGILHCLFSPIINM